VLGPYLALAAFIAAGREFWTAQKLDKAYTLGLVSLAVPLGSLARSHLRIASESARSILIAHGRRRSSGGSLLVASHA